MTTERDTAAPADSDQLPPLVVPRKRSARNAKPPIPESNAGCVPARAREANPVSEAEARAAEIWHQAGHELSRWERFIQMIVAGEIGKLWHANPPSLAAEWHRQAESARILGHTRTRVQEVQPVVQQPMQMMGDGSFVYMGGQPAPVYVPPSAAAWNTLKWARYAWAPVPIAGGFLVLLWGWAFSPPRALLIAAVVWLVLHLI